MKSQLFLKRLGLEIQLFGANTIAVPADTTNTEAVNQIMKKKMQGIGEKESQGNAMESSCMFAPSSFFKAIWGMIYLLLMLYTAFILPFAMAFLEVKSSSEWFWLDITVDILFFCDVMITLNSAYFTEAGELVSSRRRIFSVYLRSWLLVDLIACFPFYLLHQDDDPETSDAGTSSQYKSFLRLMRLPRLYRLLRLTRIFSIAKRYQNSPFIQKLIEGVCGKGSVLRLIAFAFMVTVCVHLMSCLWFFMARLESFSPETWVTHHGLRDASVTQLYVASLFWTITTLSTVGYGDIVPGTAIERVLAIAWMIFGVCFFSFTIGSLATMLNSIDTKESVLTTKLAAIDEFAEEAKLDKDLRYKLRHALRYSIEQSGFSFADKRSIFNELPKPLRFEVACAMHKGGVKQIPFFSDRDQFFVASIFPFLSELHLNESDFAYKEKEYADEIFFIAEGRCKVLLDLKYELKKLQRGSYFGEIEVIQQIPRKFSIVAATAVDLLAMNKRIFYVIKTEFPSVYDEMKQIAATRDVLNEKAKEQLIEMLAKCHNGELSHEADSVTKILLPCKSAATPNSAFHVKIHKTGSIKLRQSVSAMSGASLTSEAGDRLRQLEKIVGATHKLATNILFVMHNLECAEPSSPVISIPGLLVPPGEDSDKPKEGQMEKLEEENEQEIIVSAQE